MKDRITGLHHITAIAGSARRNYEFYTKVLGLKMVKRTVNFDDPRTYHLYYGDGSGTPGTILTFFPWEGMGPGRKGTGMATEIAYSVPAGSLSFWLKHFEEHNVIFNKPAEKFGEQYLTFLDPDGLKFELVVPVKEDLRKPYETVGVNADIAIRGFHQVTLTLSSVKATADILTGIFGYSLEQEHVNRYRFKTDAAETANIIDLVEAAGESRGAGGAGTIHHIAFRVPDEEIQMKFRDKLLEKGFHATEKIDRKYFYSVYFREPGGVLFEIATDNPGFTVDEKEHELGTQLMLPPQYEASRPEIERVLPKLV